MVNPFDPELTVTPTSPDFLGVSLGIILAGPRRA